MKVAGRFAETTLGDFNSYLLLQLLSADVYLFNCGSLYNHVPVRPLI